MKIEIGKSIGGMIVYCAECGMTRRGHKTGAEVRETVRQHKCPEVTVDNGINPEHAYAIASTIRVAVAQRSILDLTEIQARHVAAALVAALDARARLREEADQRDTLDVPLDADEEAEADAAADQAAMLHERL